MAFNQHRNRVSADNRNWSSGAAQWQRGCSGCPGGVKPSRARHLDGCHQCAGCDNRRGLALTPQITAYRHGQPASESAMGAGNTTTACRCGMSWILIGVVIFVPIAFLITYIVAWQLGHVDPVLPFISDTATVQPESGIFAELLFIGAVFVFITTYVRYRQLAEYLPPSQLPHHVRVNKAALGIGILVAFGMTLVAAFPWGTGLAALNIVHTVGALMAFGLGCVYMWMHVALSFATRPELSTDTVCWIRVVTAVVATIMFIFTNVVNFTLIHIQEWAKASAACQWTMMTSLVVFYLSYFDEFRYIIIKPAVTVTDRKVSNPA